MYLIYRDRIEIVYHSSENLVIWDFPSNCVFQLNMKLCFGHIVQIEIFEWAKMPIQSEVAMRTVFQRASKQAPTWYICMIASKSFYVLPLDQFWIRLARKIFWSYHTDISSGGSFSSSLQRGFHGTLKLDWHFPHPNTEFWTMCGDIYKGHLFKIRIFGPIPLVPFMMSLLGAVHKWHHFWLTKSPLPIAFGHFLVYSTLP